MSIRKPRRWINTRVEFEWDEAQGKFVDTVVEGYWYEGPMALSHQSALWETIGYAWYNDGTESGSTIIGTANNTQALELDTIYLCRILCDETAGGSWTDRSVQVLVDINGAGTEALDTGNIGHSHATLADQDETTQRIGSGTFLSPNDGIGIASATFCFCGGAGADWLGNEECEYLIPVYFDSATYSAGDSFEVSLIATSVTNTTPALCTIASAGGGATGKSNPIMGPLGGPLSGAIC